MLLALCQGVVVGYWVWAVRAWWAGAGSVFDQIVVDTAPLTLVVHAAQIMVFRRLLSADGKFSVHALQVLVFGAFHVARVGLNRRSQAA
jgi:uncharacterized protein YhhL (DUF1145 family)